MRLSRIVIALTAGLAVAVVPAAAGAAQPVTPQPSAPTPQPTSPDPTQPPLPYPPQPAALTVSDPTIFLGETVQLIGNGYGPNEIVDITVSTTPLAAGIGGGQSARRPDGSTVAMLPVAYRAAQPTQLEAVTNANGSFSIPFTPSHVGRYTFVGTGRESGRSASTALTVLHRNQPPLPVTGSSIGTPLKIGGGLLGAGVVMMLGTVLWRRRNRFGTGTAQ